jgi:chemotaxis response regulator CheB
VRVRKSLPSRATLAVCGAASEGGDPIEKALLLCPDIVLMGPTMPTRRIRTETNLRFNKV